MTQPLPSPHEDSPKAHLGYGIFSKNIYFDDFGEQFGLKSYNDGLVKTIMQIWGTRFVEYKVGEEVRYIPVKTVKNWGRSFGSKFTGTIDKESVNRLAKQVIEMKNKGDLISRAAFKKLKKHDGSISNLSYILKEMRKFGVYDKEIHIESAWTKGEPSLWITPLDIGTEQHKMEVEGFTIKCFRKIETLTDASGKPMPYRKTHFDLLISKNNNDFILSGLFQLDTDTSLSIVESIENPIKKNRKKWEMKDNPLTDETIAIVAKSAQLLLDRSDQWSKTTPWIVFTDQSDVKGTDIKYCLGYFSARENAEIALETLKALNIAESIQSNRAGAIKLTSSNQNLQSEKPADQLPTFNPFEGEKPPLPLKEVKIPEEAKVKERASILAEIREDRSERQEGKPWAVYMTEKQEDGSFKVMDCIGYFSSEKSAKHAAKYLKKEIMERSPEDINHLLLPLDLVNNNNQVPISFTYIHSPKKLDFSQETQESTKIPIINPFG